MNKQLIWHTEKRKIKDLTPFEHNPRSLSEKQYADLKKSLTKFDLAEIPAIDKDNKIIAGHQRLKVLSEIKGLDYEIDVRVPNRKLTKKEFEEYNIRSNKNLGDWDFDILANSFELPDLLEWGFEEKELDLSLWNKVDEEKLDEVPEVRKEAVSKTGDLFLLDGKHRILCGDSTKKEDVEKLMDGKKADVLTDPPYNKNFHYKTYDDKKTSGEFAHFCRSWVNVANSFLLPGPWNEKYYEEPRDKGIWIKENATAGASCFHLRCSEPVLFYGKFNGKRDKDYFVYSTGFTKELKQSRGSLHSNKEYAPQKPIKLWLDLIKMLLSNLVLDLFLGNGTTLIACEQTNRICYGMEIDNIYIDVILRRYHNLYPDKEIKCLNRNFNFNKLFNEAL